MSAQLEESPVPVDDAPTTKTVRRKFGATDCWNCRTGVAKPEKPKCPCGHKWQLRVGDMGCTCGACKSHRGDSKPTRVRAIAIPPDGRILSG